MTKEKLYKLIQLQPEIVKKLEVIGSQIDFDKIDHDLNQMLDSDSAKQAYDCLEFMLKGDTDHLKIY